MLFAGASAKGGEQLTSQKWVARPEMPLRALEARRLSHVVQRSPRDCSVLQKPHTCRVAHLYHATARMLP